VQCCLPSQQKHKLITRSEGLALQHRLDLFARA